ncbi:MULTISPECIES: Arc family DNA-binding protein [unclassified Sulfitobacter]|uniref:Arc family DNA-binding protein n=1 Tax=unclassified Sulfitobacter TaxID=196795 RepID=UPI0007C3A099|nr:MULTISPECIES: Arc family DNA-binding protein [unclassified Sulfitobacter]KZX95748.1 hypothetical protein A3722_17135 [Sulfitobacter sp. HI0027]KZX95971.1 hypothetical protein A3720_20575 [Sulfitobacter sp. HI0021]KZZ02739.1 hypothetical protein A3747_14420 [Sulfitobacter sp. HI0076]
MSDAPSRKQEQFIVRFPDGMRDQIKAAAEENGRSMNAEIVFRLQRTFDTIYLDNSAPGDEVDVDGDLFEVVDTPDKVDRAVERMTRDFKESLRRSMLQMISDDDDK